MQVKEQYDSLTVQFPRLQAECRAAFAKEEAATQEAQKWKVESARLASSKASWEERRVEEKKMDSALLSQEKQTNARLKDEVEQVISLSFSSPFSFRF